VRRTRPLASASRSGWRPRGTLCWPRSRPDEWRQNFVLARRLHKESTGRVFFYALLVSSVDTVAGLQACSIDKNEINDGQRCYFLSLPTNDHRSCHNMHALLFRCIRQRGYHPHRRALPFEAVSHKYMQHQRNAPDCD
jgi:hypothetical protein